MRRIYVASSWRNPYQPRIVNQLREDGHEVYDFRNPPNGTAFSWSEINPDWQQWSPDDYLRGLTHERAKKGFNSDFGAMKWADTCVLVLPSGRSAHLEAGWMAGAGKEVHVLQLDRQEPELMNLLLDSVCITYDKLAERLSQPIKGR